MAATPARRTAFGILLDIERKGAFSDELLHSSRLDGLDPRDRAFVSELTLGVERWRGALDAMLEPFLKKPLSRLDPEVAAVLRMGLYQMKLLRVPDRAAVAESVELVKQAGKKSAAGLVNAVLRRCAGAPLDPARCARLAHPAWLVERWERRFGRQITRKLLEANLFPPRAYLRLNVRFPVDETVAMLEAEGVRTRLTELPACREVLEGRPEATNCWREGRVRFQDISSQAVAGLLGLAPGCSFLDICAAPGGKTLQAIEQLGGSHGVVACDLHPRRLRLLRRLAAVRPPVDCVALDATRPLPLRRCFDRVLVDAPCSGTGTLARNPDMKWRLKPEDLPVLQRKQTALLRNALERLNPGGVLVYSTCSLESEENEEVAGRVLQEKPGFRAEGWFRRIPGTGAGDGFYACRIVRAAACPIREPKTALHP